MVEEARNFYVRRKPVLILDKRKFKSISHLDTGDTGQLIVTALKDGERLQMEADGAERITNILRAIKVEPLSNKNYRLVINKEV